MKRPPNALLAIVLVFVFSALGFCSATNVYITPNGANQGSCTTNPQMPAWFNSSANWGSGASQIGPGTTITICGTFTDNTPGDTLFAFQASGTSGNPITLLFDTGATLTNTNYWGGNGAIYINGESWITVDGAGSGIIQNTGNGTGLANQAASSGIITSGGNVEIKNLTIANLYVHTSASDTSVDQTQVNCIRFTGSNVLIHDNTMHDAGWCLYEPYANGDANVSIYNNTIYDIDHGWALATSHSGGSSGPFSFYSNNVYGYANWDTTSDAYHHDGIHCYTSQTGGSPAHITQLNIYNNLFNAPVGSNATAHIFMEGGTGSGATPCADTTSNIYIYNNVLIYDNYSNNGLIGVFSGNYSILNNTLLGKDTSSGLCFAANSLVSGMVFKNNAITNCNQLIAISNNIKFTPDYNTYGNGGSNSFVCNGNYYNSSQFSSWQSCIAGDSHSSYNTTLALSSSGIPQSGSPVVGVGINSTPLGVAQLDSDTTNGNSRSPVARPGSGPWDVGAFELSGQPPAPPTGLVATVK